MESKDPCRTSEGGSYTKLLLEGVHSGLYVLVGKFIEDLLRFLGHVVSEVSVGVTSDSSSQVHVLFHYCYSLGMDGAKVGVLEKSSEIGF